MKNRSSRALRRRVHAAMALPQIGHMDAAFLDCVEDIKSLRRTGAQGQNFAS